MVLHCKHTKNSRVLKRSFFHVCICGQRGDHEDEQNGHRRDAAVSGHLVRQRLEPLCIRPEVGGSARRGARNGSGCLGAEARRSPSPPAAARRTTRPFSPRRPSARRRAKKHIISTAFEHHAVLHTLKKLKKYGYEITLLDVHETASSRPSRCAALSARIPAL